MSQHRPPSSHDPLEGRDAAGMITTGAHRRHVPAAFEPVLEAAMQRLAQAPGTPSLYVYDSVATGMARPGRSDVDLMTVGLDAALARDWGRELSTAFAALCRGVEIGAAEARHYEGPGDEAHGNRVFLRHYGVHLAGPDPRAALPDQPADRAAARGFNGDIGQRAGQWRRQLASAAPAALARRLARKTLFAVAGLVSVHDTVWTTDRVAAAHRWSRLRPELAAALDTLVAWGDGPSPVPSQREIELALDGVVASVVADFQAQIGLWPESATVER